MFICQIFCHSEHTANEQTEQAEHGEALHEHILRALVRCAGILGAWGLADHRPYGLRVVAHVNYGKSISVIIVCLRLRFPDGQKFIANY